MMTDEEKKPYHKIMVDAWRLFIKDRQPEQFSDKWWKDIIGDYDKLREPYKGQPLDNYVCHISQVFLDEYERLQRHARPEGVSKGVLHEPQGYHQEELQCTDTVPEVGGCEEDAQTLSAEDWG